MKAALSELHRGGVAEVRFECSPNGQTFIAHQHVAYPFHVTRPFYLEGDPEGMSTLYLQSVSGGLYDRDVVHLLLEAGDGASAQVTTQSATIVHQTQTDGARQHVTIKAHDNAYIEYLPDPMVLFPGARLQSRTQVIAPPTATVVLTDGFLSHDPQAANRCFERYANELSVESTDGTLRCLDRFELTGARLATADQYFAHGTLVWVDAGLGDDAHTALDHALAEIPGVYAGVSALPDHAGLWSRVLATDSHALRASLSAGWSAIRELKTGLTPHPPRK